MAEQESVQDECEDVHGDDGHEGVDAGRNKKKDQKIKIVATATILNSFKVLFCSILPPYISVIYIWSNL